MKTAISLPDSTFERATEKSKELGISRSEFFARAAEVYLDELAGHSLTRQIDEALQTAGTDESSSASVSAGRRRLAKDDW
jgi:predicted DNA-binding protein